MHPALAITREAKEFFEDNSYPLAARIGQVVSDEEMEDLRLRQKAYEEFE